MIETIKKQCLEAILSSNRDAANKLIEDYTAEYGYEDVLTLILDPVLIELGNLWTSQLDVTFAQVYVSAKIAEDIIIKVLDNTSTEAHSDNKKTIVIGNIEDDFHSLGRKLVGTFLTSSNWHVVDLGNDVTAEEFVDTAIKENANIIMVSAMMYTTAQNISTVREEINSRGYKDKLLLAVGGAVFNLRTDLWLSVGADGTSRNAIDACTLAKSLQDKIDKGLSDE